MIIWCLVSLVVSNGIDCVRRYREGKNNVTLKLTSNALKRATVVALSDYFS
ncbi:hypothetical protein PROSTU_03601 [Providencia stuartii ATCC 25827]|uniref:Uncharacterized protein n=1 Tax=Providencia stuartii ATCC 25827 TaxID=471874 RepID=A0AA86YXJ0_PROST|nr:hypothetical protein PROSTU_03601 [Providencia stuartii ATCC 25827]